MSATQTCTACRCEACKDERTLIRMLALERDFHLTHGYRKYTDEGDKAARQIIERTPR